MLVARYYAFRCLQEAKSWFVKFHSLPRTFKVLSHLWFFQKESFLNWQPCTLFLVVFKISKLCIWFSKDHSFSLPQFRTNYWIHIRCGHRWWCLLRCAASRFSWYCSTRFLWSLSESHPNSEIGRLQYIDMHAPIRLLTLYRNREELNGSECFVSSRLHRNKL